VKLVLVGPMSGLPDHNYPAFFEAAELLEQAGYQVVNPAAAGKVEGWSWTRYLRRSVGALTAGDAVATLPGTVGSRGALVELAVAALLGMGEASVEDWLEAAADRLGGAS
jgi:hypothetical protein